jgi:hypothetical protein
MHLVLIIGAPAAGKMTVGAELAALTGYKLFHNHMTIEPFLDIFEWGSPSFDRLRSEVRRRVVEEAVAAELPGLIFTFVWALDADEDRTHLDEVVAPAVDGGWRIDVVELLADQQTRLGREGTTNRLAHKRTKRDVEWCRAHLVEMDELHRFVSEPEEHVGPGGHWRFDNSGDDPVATARDVVDALGIATSR